MGSLDAFMPSNPRGHFWARPVAATYRVFLQRGYQKSNVRFIEKPASAVVYTAILHTFRASHVVLSDGSPHPVLLFMKERGDFSRGPAFRFHENTVQSLSFAHFFASAVSYIVFLDGEEGTNGEGAGHDSSRDHKSYPTSPKIPVPTSIFFSIIPYQ